MKNAEKLNLNELKVSSFVTSLEGKDSQTVKGGTGTFDVVIFVGIGVATAVAIGTLVKATGDLQQATDKMVQDAKKK